MRDEPVVRVTLQFPGGCEVTYLVRGPVRVELDDQVLDVHATDAGLTVEAVDEHTDPA